MTELGPWERLTTIATLGTRRGWSAEQAPWPDTSLATAALAGSAERALLRTAAATHVWDLAGRRASASAAPSLERFVPTTTVASEAASLRLLRMIGGDYRELIPEWFELARAADKSLAAHWLPVVLDGVPARLRNRFPRVLGAAAAWLARLNPEWIVTIAVDAPSEQRWLEGSLEERKAELTAQRAVDPARAREWLQATWSTDPPEAREAFVGALRTRLSSADEAFLETALDDKRKGVRQAAIEVLALLPQSAHARRLHDRLETLVELEPKKPGLHGKSSPRKLSVVLPSAIDKAAQRDGIDAKPPAQRKIGERAFWLVQMIALTEPSHWTTRFDCDPATFIHAALNSEYGSDLLSALSEAASRHGASDWLSALSEAWLSSQQEQHVVMQAIARLLAAVPLESRARVLDAQVHQVAQRSTDALYYLLENVDLTWTPTVTAAAIEYIAERARMERQQWSHARNALDTWGRRCHIDTALELLPNVLTAAGETSPWRNALEQFNDIVEFRAAMKRELM